MPVVLTPGEGVVPKGIMEGLSNLARSGNMGGSSTHYHAHVRPIYNLQALDTAGLDRVLANLPTRSTATSKTPSER